MVLAVWLISWIIASILLRLSEAMVKFAFVTGDQRA